MAPFYRMNPSTMVIEPHRPVSINPRGLMCRVWCITGRLWVTAGGSAEDWLLAAGDQACFCGGGMVVIEALRTSTIRVEAVTGRNAAAAARRI